MEAIIREWFNLFVRWTHVLAAILWIGDSFLFMWLDSHLAQPSAERKGDVTGELWMVHSGGFYEVVKRKSLAKNELPPALHWFKWESYTTWISGFFLLIIVYELNGASLLIDPSVMVLTQWQAVAISLGLLPVAYGIYELLWQTPLAKDQRLFAAVGVVLVAGLAWGLTHVFAARGAFLLLGATLATIMAANVRFRIIPAQKHMLAMTHAGTPVDTRYGARAKGRSIQNHYLTLPVIFAMLSNHFPSTYGSSEPWLVITLLFVFGAGIKYAMNHRRKTAWFALVGTAASFGVVLLLTKPVSLAESAIAEYQGQPTVSFATVQTIVHSRCITCHAPHPATPMFASPPEGITFDTPANISRHAQRMFVRAVVTKTMPLGNLTGMTLQERDLLGAWYAQGANIHAEGPSQLAPAAPLSDPLAALIGGAKDPAQAYFAKVCAACHGESGQGNGMAARALKVKPRNFTNIAWQKSVTDAHIRKTILEGGASVGKSDLMPANTLLKGHPKILDGLVRKVRSFAGK